MPRVITGRFRGTQLFAPKGDNTRPTTDKVKEALFSMIQTRVYDAKVLDLFSGTGQIGIEAISRGAEVAYLVDKGGPAIQIIKNNLEKIRADDKEFIVMKKSMEAALTDLGEQNKKFDIIFMDPPYKMAEDQAILAAKLINRYDLLEEDGRLIVEHSSELPFDPSKIQLNHLRSCSYGLSVITFFSKENQGD